MKRHEKYRIGIFAGLLVFSLAACTDLLRPGETVSTGEAIPEGKGLACIRLSAGEAPRSVRTAVPPIGGLYFTLQFTAPGKTAVSSTLDGSVSLTLMVPLEPADWTLEARGYADSTLTALKASGSISVPVTAGTTSNFEVFLTPDFDTGGTGSLAYTIGFPSAVSRAFFALYPMDVSGESREIDISTSAGGTASDTLDNLPEGSYRAAIELYNPASNKEAAWTGVVHIYGDLTTSLNRTFTAPDFAECPPVIAGATLAAKLNTALASSSGSYTVVLGGAETDLASFTPKTLTATSGKNIHITIRGGGRTVRVGSTGTSLFTLGAASGASLTLTLQDITLRGLSGNSVPVVRVESGGTLFMKAGSLITGNTYSSFSSYGGGVYVDSNGAFTMSGGTVSENTAASSYGGGGGGGYVHGGTFTMNGGSVSGNTITSSSSSSYSS
jgi:hypothetical protein